MNSMEKANLLRKMGKGRIYREERLIRHTDTNCSVQDLSDMVENGLLLKINKNPNNFMSDNR